MADQLTRHLVLAIMKQFDTFSPASLAVTCADRMRLLPLDKQADIQRVYHRTWSIVELHQAGLITPKPAAKQFLLDLAFTITREIVGMEHGSEVV